MKSSGLKDLEQQMHALRHHLHELQKPTANRDVHRCMPMEELTCNRLLSHVGGDRLEGEARISNRQKVFEEVSASRHSCLAEGSSPWRAPEKEESTALEAFGERLELTEIKADLVGPKLAREPSDKPNSYLNVSDNSSRACRICNKQFPSGRALGGHMRVHGPFFAPGSVSSRLSYGVPAANTSTQGGDGNGYDVVEEDSGTPSIVEALDAAEVEEDSPLQVTRYAQVASSGYGAHRTVCLGGDNSYAGEIDVGPAADSEEESDIDITERRLVSLITDNSHITYANSEEAAKITANNTARTSRLSKLRHNPKRSRWFAEQEFAFELASMGDSQGSFPVERRSVCSECGKAFPSERALFGHMRCHRDRDRRSLEGRSEQPVDAMGRQRRKWRVLDDDKLNLEIPQMVGSKRREAMDMEELVNRREEAILVGDKVQDGCFSSGMMQDDVPARWPTAGRRSRRNVGASKVEPDMENRETSSSTLEEDEPVLTSETISLELGVEDQEIETPDFLIMLADAARKIEEETVSLLNMEKYACLISSHAKRSKDHQMDVADYHPHEIGDEHEDMPPGHDRLAVGSIGKYECTTCKKTFNTHQALGGHRASHKKTKGCFARTGSSDASEEHELEDEVELSHVHENKGVVITKKKKRQQQQVAFKGHACSICHRIFLTGQALGGHKRCHWTGEKPSETVSVASTNKQLSLQSEGQSMVDGGIDLNRPAPVEEDADEVGFAPTEMLSVDGEGADQESEVEKRSYVGADLALDTSTALAWAVKDLWKDDKGSLPLPPLPQNIKKETEVRHRFDGIWGQHWPNNIGVTQYTQVHRLVYAMQSPV